MRRRVPLRILLAIDLACILASFAGGIALLTVGAFWEGAILVGALVGYAILRWRVLLRALLRVFNLSPS